MESVFALIQMESVAEPAENLKKAEALAAEAARKYRPDFLLFPETFMSELSGSDTAKKNAYAQTLDGPFVSGMRELAKRHGVWVVFGMKERTEDAGELLPQGGSAEDLRSYNSVVMLNSGGEIVRVYRKTHLYDAFGYRESNEFKAGERFFEPVDTPFGKIGLFVCYELRFPEVARYQRAKGADIILLPTAWVKGDLKSLHFRTLVTARAIENTVYVLACDQYSKIRMGESIAVDPMGVTLASAGEGERIVPVYIDTERIAEVRAKLPSYEDRRPELYTV